MGRKFYDFGPGMQAVKRMISVYFQKIIAKNRIHHEYKFFTDGIGYIDQQIIADGIFEKGLIDHIKNVVIQSEHNQLYIDIGANIGNHVVSVSNLFSESIAFEPHPALFHVLSANIIANKCPNVKPFNYGLGREKIKATLVESPQNHGLSKVEGLSTMSSDFFDLNDDTFSIKYEIDIHESHAELSKYSEKLKKSFIKIDVEGMEYDILSSLKTLIEEHNPIVAFEWVPQEQPELNKFINEMNSYYFYGVYISQSKNFIIRHLSNLFLGRKYNFTKLNMDDLPELIPLVFMIPNKINIKSWFQN